MKEELFKKSIRELHTLLEGREISHVDLVKAVEEKIDLKEKVVNAYITLTIDKALEKARILVKKEKVGACLLSGIPISVKDTFTTKGVRTTVASKILEDFIPTYSATSFERLKNKGAILMGKTNMDEFAHGFTTEYSAFGTTRNPLDLTKVPGGSSGGAAASVASGEAILALASENFGSIIQPAALCGVVGMKPTYGRASRYGIIAMVSSLECPGIIGRCVEDTAIGIEAISGWDTKDATTVNKPNENYIKELRRDIKGKKLAVIEPIIKKVDSEIGNSIKEALKLFEQEGAIIEYINWYDLELDLYIYEILYRAEVASNLARYDGLRYGHRSLEKHNSLHEYYITSRDKFGKHVKRMILTDPITLDSSGSNLYEEALALRRINRDYIDSLFEKYDVIVTPASTFVEMDIGSIHDSKWRDEHRDLKKITSAMFCPTALYGYPAITFPIGKSKSGMPIGIHMYAKRFDGLTLFDLGAAFERLYCCLF